MKTIIRWSTQHRLSAPEFIMGFLGFLTLLLTASTFLFWNTMRPNEQETALFYLPINLLFSCFAWGCAVYHWKTSQDHVRSIIRWIMILIIIVLHLDTIRGNVQDVSLITNSNLVMFFLLMLLIKNNPLKSSLLYFFISWIFLSITVQLDEDVDLSVLPFLGQMMALVLFGIILYSLKNERTEKLLIEEKLSLEQQLRNQAELLATEQERIRIAREIHDGLGASLAAIHMYLNTAKSHLLYDGHPSLDAVTTSLGLTKDCMIDIRRSVANMHESHGSPDALASKIRYFISRCEIPSCTIMFHVEGVSRIIQDETFSALYRIIQELLTNARKHSKATSIEIILNYSLSKIGLTISDNGVGADSTKTGGFGLKGIEERLECIGGSCSFYTEPGKGFTAIIEVFE